MNTLTPAQLAGACSGGALTEAAALAAGPSSAAVQQARPFFTQYPYLSFINSVANNAHSNYNSMQVTITKRMSHGLSFTTGYTYGHGLDNGSLNRFGGLPQNSQDPNAEYGSSDFDVRNRLTITGTYNIPGKKGYGQLLDGWQINSIYSYSTPMPWIAFDQNGDNISGDGEVGSNGNSPDRWDIVGSALDFPVGTNSNPFCIGGSCTTTTPYGPVTTAETAAQTALCTADAPDPLTLAAFGCYPSTNGKSAIVPPHLGQFGNMGRNIFRDYGFQDWDMSIFKNFKFKERFGIQARWEVFNVLNRPVPGNPYGGASFVNAGNGLGAPGLGAPGATNDILAGNPLIGSGSNRAMQVGLKITF